MSDTWITDITHFLDESGQIAELPTSARNLVHHLGSIVSATVAQTSGVRVQTSVKCRRRPSRKPCCGQIVSVIESESSRIAWACPVCEDNGLISGWQGSPWDSREGQSSAEVTPIDRPRITRIMYRGGMVEALNDVGQLETTVLEGPSLSLKIVDAIHESHLLELAGEYGYLEVGEPIQYDHLAIEHDAGRTEITVYNRAIMLFHTDDDIYRRIHRVCSAIDRAGGDLGRATRERRLPNRNAKRFWEPALPNQGGGDRGGNKVRWKGMVTSVQPRIRLTRSFDQRSHTYLGYSLRLSGVVGDDEREFLVGIGKAAQEKHRFRAGDLVSGQSRPVLDSSLEVAEFYKTSRLAVIERSTAVPNTPPPWFGAPPNLGTYRERGHRRLASRTYDARCRGCIWGCRMPVDMIVDQWSPRKRRYRFESFCYGPKSCAFYRAGPTRKVPGRRGMIWEEEDWVDEEATSHRSRDE